MNTTLVEEIRKAGIDTTPEFLNRLLAVVGKDGLFLAMTPAEVVEVAKKLSRSDE